MEFQFHCHVRHAGFIALTKMFKTALFRLKLVKLPQKCYSTSTNILNILKHHKTGDSIEIKGWVKSLRNQKENIFINVSDGSCPQQLQITIPKTLKPKLLTIGASIEASGSLSQTPKGQVEILAEQVNVFGACVLSEGYPFAPRKQYEPEYIRQFPHFRVRTNKFGALLRIRHFTNLAIHNYLNKKRFFSVNTPILTCNDCEGAGEVFKVIPENSAILKSMLKPGQSPDEAYFDGKSFLTVSGQLHLEAVAHGLGNVYTLGPTFRAENSKSRLHLSEFYMLEVEMAFANKLEQITNFTEAFLKEITNNLLEECGEDLKICGDKRDFSWLNSQFPVLTHKEALQISSLANKEDELKLVKHCNSPVFVTDWPKDLKPFYMKQKGDFAAAFDLLAPVSGEIVGGGLREDSYDKLKEKLPGGLDWYLELRKFGGVATGGFGMGLERYLQAVLGIDNIKDVIPFPRWPHNCSL